MDRQPKIGDMVLYRDWDKNLNPYSMPAIIVRVEGGPDLLCHIFILDPYKKDDIRLRSDIIPYSQEPRSKCWSWPT